jgi:hypothetical protein
MRTMTEPPPLQSNGDGAAAILAAGFGCLALGVFALAGDALPWAGKALNLWKPAGALSGVSTAATLTWLASWFVLGRFWAGREVRLGPVIAAAIAMLAGGLLLTFPPFMDLVQGK